MAGAASACNGSATIDLLKPMNVEEGLSQKQCRTVVV